MYIFYIILFVVLAIIEVSTFNLVTIWMALSSLFTSIYAYLFPEAYLPQAFIFISLSLVFIAVTKPLTKKFIKKSENTNADRLIGEIGVVIVDIDNINGVGQVKVKNQIWSAKSDDGSVIPSEEKVKINKIEGVKLVVKQL